MPQEIATLAEFKQCLADNQKVVCDFTATWCGPCRMIGPYFAELESSGNYPNVKFIKVDVDANADAAQECGISAMPTFHAFVNGEKDGELVGASKEKLQALVQSTNSK